MSTMQTPPAADAARNAAQKSIKRWAAVALCLAGLYPLLFGVALFVVSDSSLLGRTAAAILGWLISILLLIGWDLARKERFVSATWCILIAGFLGLPLGVFTMFVGAMIARAGRVLGPPPTALPVVALGRISGALLSPKDTFADTARRPTYVAPIVLFSLLSLCFLSVMNQRVDWESFIRQQAEKNSRFAQMPEEQKQYLVERQAKYVPVFAYVFGLYGAPLLALILASVYLGAFNLFAGAGLRFGQAFGIASHALLPTAIGSVLGIITMLLKSRGDVDPERLLASNVAALLPGDAPRWQVSLGSSLDIFWIWVLILIGVGFAAANPKKISTGKGVGIVFAIWAVWLLVKVGWAALLS